MENISALRRLRLQVEPTRIAFNADERNSFGCMTGKSIFKGLEQLPPRLRWLRRAFGRFYRNHKKLHYRVHCIY